MLLSLNPGYTNLYEPVYLLHKFSIAKNSEPKIKCIFHFVDRNTFLFNKVILLSLY